MGGSPAVLGNNTSLSMTVNPPKKPKKYTHLHDLVGLGPATIHRLTHTYTQIHTYTQKHTQKQAVTSRGSPAPLGNNTSLFMTVNPPKKPKKTDTHTQPIILKPGSKPSPLGIFADQVI